MSETLAVPPLLIVACPFQRLLVGYIHAERHGNLLLSDYGAGRLVPTPQRQHVNTALKDKLK